PESAKNEHAERSQHSPPVSPLRHAGHQTSGNWPACPFPGQHDSKDAYRRLNILKLGLTEIDEFGLEFVVNLVVYLLRQANTAGRGECLHPCRDVHPVTVDRAIRLLDDIAKVKPDPETQT